MDVLYCIQQTQSWLFQQQLLGGESLDEYVTLLYSVYKSVDVI